MIALRIRLVTIGLLLGALAAAGCGGSGASEKLVPVSGKVNADGHPMAVGMVTYTPDEAKGNTTKLIPTGAIQADGSYKLNSGGKEGAPVGWYKVSVTSTGMPADMTAKPSPPVKLNPKFLKPESSGLSVEVADPAKPGAYDLAVTK